MAAFEEVLEVPEINEDGARACLSGIFWPQGLQDIFIRNLKMLPIRFFICDDSGSMVANDGHRLLALSNGDKMMVTCTRWTELVESLKFHVDISRAANAASQIRTLNGASPFIVGGTEDSMNDVTNDKLTQFFETWPNGMTPLCKHVKEVIAEITNIKSLLESQGKKACLVIFTDGEATDGDLFETMQPLHDLPVWIVVRLCTDDPNIVDFWNRIDKEFEKQIDVLDDFFGETEEVQKFNSWLTYGDALHQFREFGVAIRDLDRLDEELLTVDQIKSFCAYIFGGSPDSFPHPLADWNGFRAKIEECNNTVDAPWSLLHKARRPWISLSEIATLHHITHT